MGTRTNDCRKFTPNIFNKSKCSHCFRQREEHSAAALECNRSTRKVSKCGYLFVAPDWDFNNPLYRTKRWQRRWFVLYDDGELTYSVDEHPETIPQAIIDMTKVLEVTTAEDVTGHTNSIAITASDRVTFVKGTCPEEAKWWLNVLQAFPKSKGRHKRNATFPGGKTTTIIQTTCPTNTRARHNSYHKDTLATSTFNNLVDIIPTTWNTVSQTPKVITTSRDQDENNKNAGNELTDEENNSEDKSALSDSKSLWSCSINALTISNPDKSNSDKIESSLGTNNEKSDNVNSLKDEVDYVPAPRPDLEVQSYYKEVSSRPKSLALASKTAPAIVSAIVKKVPPVIDTTGQNTNSGSISSLRVKPSLSLEKTQTQERGDPDGGCTLDDLSASYLSKTAEFRIGMPVDENLSSKKGWLMKQDTRTGEWTKHWFALRGAALFYYRDQLAEERGVLDGVLDANSLISVVEVTSQKKYSFQLTTWDNRRIVLSAVSANSRNNWINVLHSVAGIQRKIEPKTSPSDSCSKLIIKDNASDDLKREIEKDLIKTQRTKELISRSHKVCEAIQESIPLTSAPVSTPTTFTTPKNLILSSDEEYRTASEGGRRDSVDWGSPLSPSPPIPRALFRSKERIRTRSTSSNSRFQNRSRSSPPSSRRSTVDSVGSDDIPLIHPVEEECTNEKQLQIRLDFVEKERDSLRDEARERESRMAELLSTLDRTELELNSRIQETEQARDSLSMQLLEANNKAEKIIGRMTLELEQNEKRIKDLEEQLVRGIDENDTLYKKIDEMENSNSSGLTANLNRQKMKRVDSLSDLTNLNDVDPYCLNHEMLADEYNELRSRFEKAVNEIRAMKKELRESQKEFDSLELSYTALKQDLEQRENEDKSQLQMMAERIQDLTFKYSGSERQVRILKQKLAKFERRKSLSLKGKEVTEDKGNDLENKVDSMDKSATEHTAQESFPADEKLTRRLQSHARRKSLDGNMNTSTDSLNLLVRQSASEKRIAASIDSIPDTFISKNNSSSSPNVSEHIVERLRYLEKVLVATKDKLEQNQMYLHSLRSSRSRRSVSPMTDRKDSLRFIERCLNEVIKLLRDSCESCVVDDFDNNTLMSPSNPVKLALAQVDSQLKLKLNELLTQRRVLRERNELSSKKNLELVAERIAYESVCFGILRDSIRRAEDPTCTRENWTKAEIAETSQLMAALKSKLGGKCSLKPKGSLDILARILARRLVLSQSKKGTEKQRDTQPICLKAMDVLLRQQNELNLITKRYKNNVMESLAANLAAETLSYISSNDVVQGTVQEVWRQAQEAVNTELVQSEIAHIMIRNAQRFENSMTPSFGYCLTTEEIVSFENFADAVHDVLRKEIDNAIEQLTHCYEENLNKMKRGQWRLHLEQERKACEGRQLLSEFADVIAHKAFVDARISVLRGDYKSNECFEEDAQNINFSALQKYENLFEELASDLQIDNAGDILAEADFNFMYRNYTFELLNNKSELNEVFAALRELEKAIDLLPSTTNREKNEKSENCKIKSFKDFIDECFQVRTRIGAVVECLKESTNSCEHCQKMQNSICNLTSQHETEMNKLQKEHESDVNALRLQIEEHLNSIKVLECERMSILKDLNLHSNVIENRERELETISQKLKDKEKEYDRKTSENLELFEQLGEEQHKCKILLDENSKLRNKCLHQNDEYAALLQERDFVQTELNKERERARRLEKRLEMLETEHTKQLECLQQAYKEQIMTHCTDLSGVSEGESFHQRYQSEIEQLRTLCEKGLAAMESSHRRIIKDLEDKHRQEIERLLIEKDQALAEETQATLAALDAMRKAHQSEVQREIARFKQDFLRQVQKSGTTAIHANEKEEELDELRQEILSFSEKYSVKCVENAALEEKLHIANQKLRHFQQMQQLELRNKQFRAHLASEDISDLKFVQGLRTKEEVNSPDSEV